MVHNKFTGSENYKERMFTRIMKKICVFLFALLLFMTGCSVDSDTDLSAPEASDDITASPYAEPKQTGWVEDGEKYYYLLEDGSLATGKHEIDGKTYCFDSNGLLIILVNPWNHKPDNYKPELVSIGGGKYVHAMCYDDLMQMLSDCKAAGHTYNIDYAYRSYQLQTKLFINSLTGYLWKGYSREKAGQLVGKATAVPGTSEHELGLALDIVDKDRPGRNSAQANTDTQKWLMANSWKYGFILRYPNGKTNITGIIFEPWHYRYVGKEIAKEIYESGMCLEEYLEAM